MSATSITLEAESTLTERYQTTVPMPVRLALQLEKHDKVRYSIRKNGDVVISRVLPQERVSEESDPVLGHFLNFMATDMRQHPEHLQALNRDLAERLLALTANVDVNLDEPLSPDDE